MKILPQSIEKVKQTADIVEVVGDYVSLKRAGKDYKALCPFHNERTPSFTVIPAEQFYYCHGCKATGNALGFVQAIENLTFPQAVEVLAQRYNIALEYAEQANEEEQKGIDQEKESILAALRYAKDFFVHNLYHTEEGKTIGLTYLQERGFLPQTIQHFALGYSVESWDNLLKNALKKGLNTDILLKANLITQTEQGKIFDRFRERVMFPIHNFMGEIVGFGARTLKSDKNIAKYLNSSEIVVRNEAGEVVYDIYVKSKILYGMFQAKKSIKQKDACLLVEGYADVIALHQAGLTNAVASSGTSLTTEQVQLIRRLTTNIILLYDGDSAGVKAALRGIDIILAAGMQLQLVLLPDGEDPDSYLKKYGGIQLEAYISQQAKDFLSFIYNFYTQNPEQDFQQHSQMIRQIAQTLTIIPDEVVRQQYLQKAQLLFERDAQTLTSEYNKILLKKQDNIIREVIQEALPIAHIYHAKSFLERKAQELGLAEKMLFYRYKNAKIRYIAKVGLSKKPEERTSYYLSEATKFQALGIQVHIQEIQQSLDRIETEDYQSLKAEEALDVIGTQVAQITKKALQFLDLAEREAYLAEQAQNFRLDKDFIEAEFSKIFQKLQQVILKITKENDSKKRSDLLQIEAKKLGIPVSSLVEYFETQSPDLPKQPDVLPIGEELVEKSTEFHLPKEQDKIQENAELLQERECVKYLLKHGQKPIAEGENTLFYEYILEEVSDIQFLHPIYSQVIAQCRTEWLQGNLLSSEYFLNSPNEELQKAVTRLLLPDYEISQRWETIFNVPALENDKQWISQAIYENIIRLKLHKIERMLKEQEPTLKQPLSPEEQDSIIVQLMSLKALQTQLAHELRTIIRPLK